MGWLWAATASTPAAPAVHELPPAPDSTANHAPNEPVDHELEKFFELLKQEAANENQSTPSTAATARKQPPANHDQSEQPSSSASHKPSFISSWLSSSSSAKSSIQNEPPAPPRDALSETLLPTDMACRQAFDLAWACNSLGGQWNAVYRYGTLRSCSEQWDDFWFCMRTKSYTGNTREGLIRQHYRNKEHRRYGGDKPNSEDIWESREHRLPPGSVFTEKMDFSSGVNTNSQQDQNDAATV